MKKLLLSVVFVGAMGLLMSQVKMQVKHINYTNPTPPCECYYEGFWTLVYSPGFLIPTLYYVEGYWSEC